MLPIKLDVTHTLHANVNIENKTCSIYCIIHIHAIVIFCMLYHLPTILACTGNSGQINFHLRRKILKAFPKIY